MEKNILLSICCLAYNHEPFIRQCLDGFVMQKTNFNFEILINDDASTDGTADIIREYEIKYPDIIKPIYQKENQYSKGVPVFINLLSLAQYKYIAVCEGDDYWTDPNKLQKQVDFMEANYDYSVCAHETLVVNEKTNSAPIFFRDFPSNAFKGRYKNIYTIEDTFESILYHTSSVLMRNIGFQDLSFFSNIVSVDNVLTSYCASFGKIYVLDDVMSVYRINQNGITSQPVFTNTATWLTQKILLYSKLNDYFECEYSHILNDKIAYYKVEMSKFIWGQRNNMTIAQFLYNFFIKADFILSIQFLCKKIFEKICQ